MGKMSRLGNDLYQGRRSIDFVKRPWPWYAVSIVLVGLAIATAIWFRPLQFGVEFTGGSSITVQVDSGNATQANADKLSTAIADANIENATDPTVTTAGDQALAVQVESLDADQKAQITQTIQKTFPQASVEDISISDIGPSWGKEVANRAGLGVAIFLVLVVIFIWIYFREWKMSVAAIVALVHDCGLTIGVYALSGFEVTPAAVTGLLAILGFSLYDTVVVFDKIKENTTKLRRPSQTYADAANLAVNQTLVRSINTSIVALIPIGAILFVSSAMLGASTLKDLALAQFVGMGAGVYSSVMLAPRIIVHLKGRDADEKERDRRAKIRARKDADRYASVPSFSEGMPMETPGLPVGASEDDFEERPAATPRPEPKQSTMGKGRTLPEQHRPVGESGSSGRSQPQRKPRSQR